MSEFNCTKCGGNHFARYCLNCSSPTYAELQSKITDLEALLIEKDKALNNLKPFLESAHGAKYGDRLKISECLGIIRKALSLTPADIRSQLEEARKEIERLRVACHVALQALNTQIISKDKAIEIILESLK